MMSCPNCDACHYSYSAPTEDDPEVIVKCNSCGAKWAEPNDLYIQARKRDLENDYFDHFGNRR